MHKKQRVHWLGPNKFPDKNPLTLHSIQRYPLAFLPTPLVEAPRLSAALGGPRIIIKRDDMTGFGFGGNKVRVMEYYLAAAIRHNATVIVTAGGPQSNHVRATAAAARISGIDVISVMHGSRPKTVQGNFLLDEILNVKYVFTNSPDRSLVDNKLSEVVEDLSNLGQRPYLIPRGGATGLGSLGYVQCVKELDTQITALGIDPDWIVLATGSCGTQAGLLVGMKIYGLKNRLLGITVSRPKSECCERIQRITKETLSLLKSPIGIVIRAEDIIIQDAYFGAGYGIPTPECIEAIRLVANTEALFLDPTYTAKAMAGLIGEINSGQISKDETVIFLHTGGEPGLFAHPELITLLQS